MMIDVRFLLIVMPACLFFEVCFLEKFDQHMTGMGIRCGSFLIIYFIFYFISTVRVHRRHRRFLRDVSFLRFR